MLDINGKDDRRTVMHLSEAFGGGVQTAVLSYVNNSKQFSHQLVVRKRPSHDVGSTPDVDTVSVTGSLPVFLWKARKQVVRTNPDIVHLHSSYAGVLRLILPLGTRIVYTPHSYAFCRMDVSAPQRVLFRLTERLLSRRRQVIAAVSPFEVHQAVVLAGDKAKTCYLPNVSKDEPAQVERLGLSTPSTVVMVGRIMAQKDPEFYMQTKQRSTTNARWLWVGDGDASTRSKMEASGIEVTGWLKNSDVLDRVADATLYFHCARWEGAPVTAVEAASLDTPVLVREIPEMEGLGFKRAGSTPEAVSRSIDRFLADESFRNDVRAITRATAVDHSPTAQQEALGRIYGYAMGSLRPGDSL